MEQKVQKNQVKPSHIKRWFSTDKELLFVAGLRISYAVANFIFIVLITLLTDIWQLKLLQAVSITNIQDGAKGIIAIFIAFLADAYLGDSITLLLSALVYSGGLVMMYFAYPNITDEEIKACRERHICEEKSIGVLFYLALVLVTIGQCGHKNYMEFLKWEEKIEKKEKYDQRTLTRQEGFTKRIIKRIHNKNANKNLLLLWKKKWSDIVGFLIAVLVLPYIVSSNRSQLLIRACMLGFSSCLFIAGRFCLFPSQGPRGSPMLMVFHVIFVAFKKQDYDTTGTSEYLGDEIGGESFDSQNTDCESETDIGAYYSNDDIREPKDDSNEFRQENGIVTHDHNTNPTSQNGLPINNHDDVHNEIDDPEAQGNHQNSETAIKLTKQLRFLNKAALYNPLIDPQIEVEYGRLCTVKEVEDAKCFIRAALLSFTFLTYGLIQAVSKTFFVEQANNMDRHYRSINLPVQIFNQISTIVEILLISFCQKNKRTKPRRRFHGAIRICLGMFASCFCFIAAFLVEENRLKALQTKRTLTAFWLLPQLILMGLMDGLAKSGIADFFDNEMPNSISLSYGNILADGVTGVGKLLSIALLVVVNNVTEQHGHPSWFKGRINDSRIDKFYILMIGFGFVSWIIFAVVALLECHHKSTTSRRD